MTRKEAMKWLKAELDVWENECKSKHPVKESLKMAIKALEQEFILDKIRSEIEGLKEGITSYYNDRPWIFKDKVLDIIDKYQAESEDE